MQSCAERNTSTHKAHSDSNEGYGIFFTVLNWHLISLISTLNGATMRLSPTAAYNSSFSGRADQAGKLGLSPVSPDDHRPPLRTPMSGFCAPTVNDLFISPPSSCPNGRCWQERPIAKNPSSVPFTDGVPGTISSPQYGHFMSILSNRHPNCSLAGWASQARREEKKRLGRPFLDLQECKGLARPEGKVEENTEGT
jgi:hypothetical protein